MKKKLFCALLAATLVTGLGACGGSDEDKQKGDLQGSDMQQEELLDETTQGGMDGSEDQAADESEKQDGQADQEAEKEDGKADAAGNEKPVSGTPSTQAKPQTGSTSGTNQQVSGTPSTTTKPQQGTTSSTNKPATGTDSSASKPAIDSGSSSTNKAPFGGKSFEDIISAIYQKVGYEVATANTEVNAENMEYYLGTTNVKFKRALASEPMMSSIAHSLVLVELADGQDINAAKKAIKENINGYKWLCVGVEPENILVNNVGNYVMLIMNNEAQSFMDAFLAMSK